MYSVIIMWKIISLCLSSSLSLSLSSPCALSLSSHLFWVLQLFLSVLETMVTDSLVLISMSRGQAGSDPLLILCLSLSLSLVEVNIVISDLSRSGCCHRYLLYVIRSSVILSTVDVKLLHFMRLQANSKVNDKSALVWRRQGTVVSPYWFWGKLWVGSHVMESFFLICLCVSAFSVSAPCSWLFMGIDVAERGGTLPWMKVQECTCLF